MIEKKRIHAQLLLILSLLLGACSASYELPKETETKKIEFFQIKQNFDRFFNQLIEEFEEEHPDIEIEQTYVPDGMAVLKTRIARGDSPDIFFTYPIERDYLVRAKNNYLLDLTNEEFIQWIEPDIQSRYLIDGKMYGVALSRNVVGVIYNKDVFNRLKIEIPSTWDEFIETLHLLEEAGEQPLLMANKELEGISVFNLNLVANTFDSNYWETLNNTSINLRDDKRWRQISVKMLEILKFAQKNSLNADYDHIHRAFVNGEGVLSIIGVWQLPHIEELNPTINYGIFPFPSTNDPTRNDVLGGVDGGFAISAKTKYPEEAKLFLEFLLKKENAQRFSDFEGNISVIKGVKSNKKEVEPLAEAIQQGKSVNWPNHYWAGGTAAEEDFRKISQQFFVDQNIENYLLKLEFMFEQYRHIK